MGNARIDRILTGYLAEESTGMDKTASFPPFSKNGPPVPPDGNPGQKRVIPKDHPFEPNALKPMSKALWATSVSLGHALTAYRHINRLKSASVSPDGMLGGRGYVMAMTDLRKKLYEACESLSAITDTLYDEIMAPHWKPKLAMLDESDQASVTRFVDESQEILEDPEEAAEEEEAEISPTDDDDDDDEPSSEIPTGGPVDTTETAPRPQLHKEANSSIPVDTLSGPRVDHLDREDATGPGGSYNPPEDRTEDGWGLEEPKEYLYTSPWENVFTKESETHLPADDTPTEGYDFGLGYGARGEGVNYAPPSGEGNGTKGVYGTSSGLPGVPAGSSGDTSQTLDNAINERLSRDTLPGDYEPSVARSDYYMGDKGNLVNAPLAQSQLPAIDAAPGELDLSMMNVDYTHEDLETPYVRYDYTTPNYRQDPLHEWPEKQQVGS